MSDATPSKAGFLFTITWSLIGISLFAFVVVYMVHLSGRTDAYEAKLALERIERLNKLQGENQDKLTTYGWVDEGKGVVRIPLERAIELQIDSLRDKPVKAAEPIAGVAPAGN
jgi:hypothetical protein